MQFKEVQSVHFRKFLHPHSEHTKGVWVLNAKCFTKVWSYTAISRGVGSFSSAEDIVLIQNNLLLMIVQIVENRSLEIGERSWL